MSKTKKMLLGLATLWPMVYKGLFFMFVFAFFVMAITRTQPRILGVAFAAIFPLHILTMVGMVALLFVYIRDLFRNDRVPSDQKALWAVVLLLGGIIAMPIYWYLYIWKEPQPQA